MAGVISSVLLPQACAAQAVNQSHLFRDESGQIVKILDASGIVVEYVYDQSGNLLEIRRSSINGFSILSFSPQQGSVGARVTIQGQGFGAAPASNDVRFNGAAATVISASPSSLVVTVPAGATSGPITVTVGGQTATSSQPFTVVPSPVVSGISPLLAVSDVAAPLGASVQVTGANLQGSTFTFLPAFSPPALTVSSASIDPGGASATLSVSISAGTAGPFTLVAANGAGSSSAFPSGANTLTVLEGAKDADGDGLTNAQEITLGTDPFRADTDGDSFNDGVEVAAGSNPLDPHSTPLHFTYTVISVFNRTDPSATSGVFLGAPVSIFNRTAPGGYASGPDVSVDNLPNF
jgi:YD repeat-containing protein